ncbi:MAG: serpin family protein [Muribaculaceae bacterium]|nr:serpin family protein [Muribaculaceae bacterium]
MKKILIGMLAIAAAMSSCSDEAGSNERKDIPVSRTEAEIVSVNNEFAQKMMLGLLADPEFDADNYIVSPLSLSMDLTMLAAGTEGRTQAEILTAMGYEPGSIETANSLNKKLMAELPLMDKDTKVALANALWVEQDKMSLLKDSYGKLLADYYSASVKGIKGLDKEEGKNAINKWAKENTQGMIPELLDNPLPKNTLMALSNALYFKGEWTTKFDKKNSRRENFYNVDGTIGRVNMMTNQRLSAQAYHDDEAGYQAAFLAYGNGAYCMAVLLPDKGKTTAEVIETMDIVDIQEAVMKPSQLKATLNFAMPSFEIETRAKMVQTLKYMGVEQIFAPGKGDFSGMFSSGVSEFAIGTVFQGSKIVVDEEGTEVASATIIGNDVMAPGPMQSSEFIVDRPFVFIIAERSTGAILFIGLVSKM